MMHDLHPIISLILLVGVVAAGVWIGAETMRRLAARGTRMRWYWAGVERATRWPAGAYLGMSSLTWFYYDQWLFFLLDAVGVALWIGLLLEKLNGDQDDDFWSTVGKKLRDAISPKTAHGIL